MKRNGKKGTTIAELCIVLALVAIVSTMVISFSLLMSRRVDLSTTRLNVMNDMESVDVLVDGWLGRMKLLGAELSVQESVAYSEIRAETESETYTLFFDQEEGLLRGTLPDGKDMVFGPDVVRGVEFKQIGKILDETDRLFLYTLIYDLPGVGGGEETQQMQTFCANPRVGDTYGSVSGAGGEADPEDTSEEAGGAAE